MGKNKPMNHLNFFQEFNILSSSLISILLLIYLGSKFLIMIMLNILWVFLLYI